MKSRRKRNKRAAEPKTALTTEPPKVEAKPEVKPEIKTEDEAKKRQEMVDKRNEGLKGLVRVKLLRALYFPISGRACKVSVPKDEIVRVSTGVYSEYKLDLKKLGPGKTTTEESEKKLGFMDKVLSSKNFAVNK